MSRFPRNCSSHTTYQARKKPGTDCAECWASYRRERKKYDIVGDAAKHLSDLLGCDVVVEARYRREGRDDAGLRVSVEKTR